MLGGVISSLWWLLDRPLSRAMTASFHLIRHNCGVFLRAIDRDKLRRQCRLTIVI
jgi:hypothetical protein